MKKKKPKTLPPMKEYKVKVKYTEDPMKVALRYTRCPICNEVVNSSWECIPCGIYLTFSQTDNFKK